MKADKGLVDNAFLREKLYSNYTANSSRGIMGFILSRGHRYLEKTLYEQEGKTKILEIGGSRNPHFNWMSEEKISRYDILDVDFPEKEISSQPFEINLYSLKDVSKIRTNTYDRVIACHVWEHLIHPEVHLEQWLSYLKPGGSLSILLPIDPGVPWGLARIVYKKKLKANGWVDLEAYDYILSLEHVNSVQNLIRIFTFITRGNNCRIKFWPFKNIRLLFPNMQIVLHVKKSNEK